MRATVKDALDIARSLLCDDLGIVWTDITLFPKVKQAYGELIAKLNLNGVATEFETTDRITVPAGDTDLGSNLPSNIHRVVDIWELGVNEGDEAAVRMTYTEKLMNSTPATTLRYWKFEKQAFQFNAATVDRDVIIKYFRVPTAPTEVNSLLDFAQSEIFIGPRVAALSVMTKDRLLAETANRIANDNLSMLVRSLVKGDQRLPVRRRPFSYMLRRGGRLA